MSWLEGIAVAVFGGSVATNQGDSRYLLVFPHAALRNSPLLQLQRGGSPAARVSTVDFIRIPVVREQAKSDLGYKPVWTVAEGLYLTLRAFRLLRNPRLADSAFEDDLEVMLDYCPWVEPQVVVTTVTVALWLQEYTAAEVAKHNKEGDAWLIIYDRVYNITDYVELHPGGDKILRNVGGDATEGFFGPQHPTHVFETVKKFQIGTLAKE
jgi:cytochrome b involved in lipid metabolism